MNFQLEKVEVNINPDVRFVFQILKKITEKIIKKKMKILGHASYLRNKDTYKKCYKKNEEHIKTRRKEYAIENREKLREYERNRDPEKKRIKNRKIYHVRKNDPGYLLRVRLSTGIHKALKRNGRSKNGESSMKYLNYSVDELKVHLESLFEPWMNLENWGVYNYKTWDDNDQSTWVWNIDHIIPASKFSYKSMDDPEFKKCWALENLRPYSAKLNIIEGNRR